MFCLRSRETEFWISSVVFSTVCFSKASFVFAIHSVGQKKWNMLSWSRLVSHVYLYRTAFQKSSVFCQTSTKCKCESVHLWVLRECVCCTWEVWRDVCEIKVRACDLTGMWLLSAVNTHTHTFARLILCVWSVNVCLILQGQCVFTQMG